MVLIRFQEVDRVLHAYKENSGTETYLGQLDLHADSKDSTMSQACSLITVPSNIRVEEEKPRLSVGHFLREHLGLLIAIPMGIALFSTPSITIRLLTGYRPGKSMLYERVIVLLWLFMQQFSLLFLLAWNFAWRVDTALRAPQPYSRILELSLAFILRGIGVAGYVCAIWQFKRFGVCIHV